MFQSGGQLHSEYFEYLNTFFNAAKDHPAEVIDRAVNIGKDLTYQPDAVKQMQVAIIDLGNQYIKVFAIKVKTLSAHDIDNLFKFMADMDNIKDYAPYKQLIDALDKINEAALAN